MEGRGGWTATRLEIREREDTASRLVEQTSLETTVKRLQRAGG